MVSELRYFFRNIFSLFEKFCASFRICSLGVWNFFLLGVTILSRSFLIGCCVCFPLDFERPWKTPREPSKGFQVTDVKLFRLCSKFLDLFLRRGFWHCWNRCFRSGHRKGLKVQLAQIHWKITCLEVLRPWNSLRVKIGFGFFFVDTDNEISRGMHN